MRVAYIMPHSYEYFYQEEKRKMNQPSEFDKKVVTNNDDYEHRICKASKLAGIEPVFYYFSSTEKNKSIFTHKYDHQMIRIPLSLKGYNYGKYGWELSLELFRELSNNNFDLIFIFTYSLNDSLPFDLYDLIALYCKNKGYPLIARHGGGSAESKIKGHKYHIKNWIKKSTLDIADKIIITNHNEELALENLGLDKNKLINLKNPIDYDNFHEISKHLLQKKLIKIHLKNIYFTLVGWGNSKEFSIF